MDKINDINQLQEMLDKTEDPQERKAIRNRLIELKKKNREQTEKNLLDLAAKREQRIGDKKAEADRDKEMKADFYDEMSKTGNRNMEKYKGGAKK